jgi:hypothetical protein
MKAEQATLLAAVVAAGASLITLAITTIVARSADLRSARRSALVASFNELGGLLYSLVALSKKMTQVKSDAKFAEVRAQAEAVAERVDVLRRDTRYVLWGIDGGFRVIKWIPVYIAHFKQERTGPRADEIIKRGTKLRKAMDAAISNAYFSGTRPSLFHRLRVWWIARGIRTYFDEGKPVPSEDELAA